MVILITDYFIFIMGALFFYIVLKSTINKQLKQFWHNIFRQRFTVISSIIIVIYFVIALLDSIRIRSSDNYTSISLLDKTLPSLSNQIEDTYSAPFSIYSHTKTTVLKNKKMVYDHVRLKYGGKHVGIHENHINDIILSSLKALILSAMMIGGILMLLYLMGKYSRYKNQILLSIFPLVIFMALCIFYGQYHILGTDKSGYDVLYKSLKSIRTAFVIGSMTIIIVIPLAVILGIVAGYFQGIIDDIIQFIYTTLESIPNILLIAAAMLVVTTIHHSTDSLEAADQRMVYLCCVMGITSWTNLCRLIRAETLKIKQMNYIEAGVVIGLSHTRIILRHILPNVLHIVFIISTLRFSNIILSEAILTYVGIGIDPTTFSWGNMITQARFELARTPAIWWNLFSAFIFMLLLVLTVNLLGDAINNTLDPKLNHTRTDGPH